MMASVRALFAAWTSCVGGAVVIVSSMYDVNCFQSAFFVICVSMLGVLLDCFARQVDRYVDRQVV